MLEPGAAFELADCELDDGVVAVEPVCFGWSALLIPDSGSWYDSLKGLGEYGCKEDDVYCDVQG